MEAEDRYDHSSNYALVERAMTLWLWGELSLRRLPWMEGEHLAQYERAVEAGVGFLRRFDSMQELFGAYFRGEGSGEADWEAGNWVERICRETGAPRDVSRSIVEDAAYFRRARELIVQATYGA
jgi:hypothetical protein